MEKLKQQYLRILKEDHFIKDPDFVNLMNEAELKAWTSFVAVIEHFVSKHKAENYVNQVNEMFNISNFLGATLVLRCTATSIFFLKIRRWQ